jgi:hypothetical protein
MVVLRHTKTSVDFYLNTQLHIPEEGVLLRCICLSEVLQPLIHMAAVCQCDIFR